MTTDTSERFVRWQGQAISQLTFAINLFIGFSVGALAYVLAYLREVTFTPSPEYARLYIVSVILLCLAVAFGVGAVVTRLLDFRATAQTARLRQEEAAYSLIDATSKTAIALGKATWKLFWAMLLAFCLGIAFFTTSLVSVYGNRILSAAEL